MTAAKPAVAAVVRERIGATCSRARALCTEGLVTVDGRRCVESSTRISPEAAVVVDKPAGVPSVADEEGNRETFADYTRSGERLSFERGAPADFQAMLESLRR